MTSNNILFIAPSFFSVEKVLIETLIKKGHHVFHYDERPVTKPILKAINVVLPFVFYNVSNNYYERIVQNTSSDIDCILIIKGEMVSKKTLRLFKKKWPKARIVLYLYDPIRCIKGIKKKIRFYDEVYSFDKNDCADFGFSFRPLFCDNEKLKVKTNDHLKYNLCFYGTMYGDRFDLVKKIDAICKINELSFYKFCYLAGRFMKLYYFFTNRCYRAFDKKDLSLQPKSPEEIATIVHSSNVVLDINEKKQSGLTIRTFEALFAGKKIITTNETIKDYGFYNSKYILIIDRKAPIIPISFFEDNSPISYDNLKKYTPEGWIKDVFKIA